MDSKTKPETVTRFEPTLALIERRLALLHQERRFHPNLPLWVLFSDAELKELLGTEEKK